MTDTGASLFWHNSHLWTDLGPVNATGQYSYGQQETCRPRSADPGSRCLGWSSVAVTTVNHSATPAAVITTSAETETETTANHTQQS